MSKRSLEAPSFEEVWPVDEAPPDFADRVLARVDSERVLGQPASERLPVLEQALGQAAARGAAERDREATAGSLAPLGSRAARGSLAPAASLPGSARARRRWRLGVAWTGLALASAAAVLLWPRLGSLRDGGSWLGGNGARSLQAEQRREARIGSHAQAVLEPGAVLELTGDRVEQRQGDVFYRVEPGSSLVVETPAGDVRALGTCFRVRVEEGAPHAQSPGTLAGAALVLVYEGRVQLSRGTLALELGAGDSGRLSDEGLLRAAPVEVLAAERARVLGPSSAPREPAATTRKAAAPGAPGQNAGAPRADAQLLARSDQALQREVVEATRELSRLELEQRELNAQRGRAQRELERRGGGRTRSEFDLDAEDWKGLAARGQLRYRLPCQSAEGWTPGPAELDGLGLGPDDAEPIRAAYARSHARVWGALRPLCVEAIGNEQVVDLVGPNTCTHVVLDVARKADRELAKQAMRAVAETRAGLLPAPPDGVPQHPVFELFWALTGETAALEADLTQSFGPEDAKRITYGRGMCAGTSSFGI